MAQDYRTLWISDVHLGTSACRAADLLNFLDAVRAKRIYLVGDIVDLERIKVSPRFPSVHREVVSALIRIAGTDTEVVYIPGNHDHDFRELVGRDICRIRVRNEAEHVTNSGKRLLITHGDVLDRRIRKGTNLESFAAAAYRWLVEADVAINQMRERLGLGYVSVSARVKQRISSANEYMAKFEQMAAAYAAERGFDGIVCGHIHRPNLRTINGTWYANDGDWVEHRTAIGEAEDGTLKLMRWQDDGVRLQALPSPVSEAA